jgi:hypothetical protein
MTKSDSRGLKVKRWRQKANQLEEWESVIKGAKFLEGS